MQDLTLDQKQKIVDELNSEVDVDSQGNVKVTSIADDPEAKAKLDELTPKQLYESQIAANIRSSHILSQLAQQMSKKNLIKLLLATVKLPEEDSYLQFGGTKAQSNLAEQAYIQAQVASNAKTFILSVDAAARSKYEKQKAQDQQQGDINEQ